LVPFAIGLLVEGFHEIKDMWKEIVINLKESTGGLSRYFTRPGLL